MSRAGFWKKDWFLGLMVAVVLFPLGPSDLPQSLERKAYAIGVRATDRMPSERIAVIASEDASIANIGRRPWPRDVHAKLADRKIDGRSDVFSLAVSLYQLACGRLPFEGDAIAQLLYRIADEPPPSSLQHNPAVPPGIVAFLGRALAKDADAQFRSGAEFAAGLRAAAVSGARSAPSVDIAL